MKTKVKIGYIGLGRRGMGVLKTNIVEMKDIEVVYISDLSENRMKRAAESDITNTYLFFHDSKPLISSLLLTFAICNAIIIISRQINVFNTKIGI